MTTYTDIVLHDTSNNYFIPYALLSRLGDVSISNPSQGQNLTYDAINQVWKNTSTSATIAWGGITGALSDQSDLVSALNNKYDASNPSGFISGITSSDVTTALGYTPYNSSNPNGYTSVVESTVSGWGFTKNAGTVTSVNNVSPVNGNVSLTIPTVNNATLTIQKNGTTVKTFTANASTDVTANITVPTKTSDLTNDSGYTTNTGTVTSVNNVSPVNGNVTLSIPSAQVNSDWNATSGVAEILNKPTIPTVNNATLTITQGGVSKGTFTANASSNVTIALDAGGGSLSGLTDVTLTSPASGQVLEYNGSNWVNANSYNRNIGEIVTSTIPLTDAGLHLLDGSLISGTGAYADFVTYIAGLVSTYPDLFETESNWQTAVTTYGVCGKFVYDSVNNTVRLPKITGIIEGTTDLTALGDLIQAGLPNITGVVGAHESSVDASGAFYDTQGGQCPSNVYATRYTCNFDASRSNPIYGNSTTVQPQTIKILYYIVIATSTKTNIQVDIDEITTDLNGKADVDLTNLSAGLTNTICTTPATTTSTASSATPAVVTENYVNGTSWYRVYSDGWSEQGGEIAPYTGLSWQTVTFLKPFANTNYVVIGSFQGVSLMNNEGFQSNNKTTTTVQVGSNTSASKGLSWYACGYIR